MSAYQTTIGEHTYDIGDDDLRQLDIAAGSDGTHHLLYGGKGYRCTVEALDHRNKQLTVNVNGRSVTVSVADRYDMTVKQLGFATQTTVSTKEVHAPMPGLVLKVMARPGDEVVAGTPLMILEAMKMENVLKAEGDGHIKTVHVKQGEAVEKRQLLIELA